MQEQEKIYDVFVVGGGINGCGVARDAAGRGYSVFLAEKQDLASGTSSGSTKLIHGGLRYLEHYEFSLVRKALQEREVLWGMAPHIIRPMRFVLPHHKGLRPAWLLRLGLFLYDHIGGRKLLPATKKLDFKKEAAGNPLKSDFVSGFEYSDCWVDDARLVVLNAMDAQRLGAEVRTRTKVIKIQQIDAIWHVEVRDEQSCAIQQVRAKILVNAAGPWVDEFLNETRSGEKEHNVRLVQGSHVIVDKLYDHDSSYIFQNQDGRIIFAIPYEGQFTMLGTTDRDFTGDLDEAAATDQEADYICKSASDYFKKPVSLDQVRHKFTGVRPLYDDGASQAQEATRDYILRVDNTCLDSALINIFGGKITTYRVLAEKVMEKIDAILPAKKSSWTKNAHLPGGDFDVDAGNALVLALTTKYPFVDQSCLSRLARFYGTLSFDVFGGAKSLADLGRSFGGGLYEIEVSYLIEHEFAKTAEDILWRRTKIGLCLTPTEVVTLDDFIKGIVK